MPKPNPIFNQTFQNYLKEIQALDLTAISQKLGLVSYENNLIISFLDKNYIISDHGFHNHLKESAPYDLSIVLCKYLLTCPQSEPQETDMVPFRDFKDSGPLMVYFSNEVEQKISTCFAGKLEELIKTCRRIGGNRTDLSAGYDAVFQFDVLPKIPVVLLFNDQDDEFDAQTNLLFERRAEQYLDAECLAILGNLLYQTLKT